MMVGRAESHIDGMKKNKGKRKALARYLLLWISWRLWKRQRIMKRRQSNSEDKQLTSLEQAEVDAISER